jgi:hypothetical protein
MEGGSKQGTMIHDRVVAELQSEFGYSEDDARVVKMILYDEAKSKVANDEPGFNLKRAEYMLKQLTKKRLGKITPEEFAEYAKKRQEIQEAKAKKEKGGKRRKVSKKKASKKKTSKKVSKRKTSKKVSKKRVSKKRVSKKRVSKKTN